MGNYSSALIPVTEEFDSVVSMAERLNEQVALMMEEEEKQKQSQEIDSSSLQENSQEMSQNGPSLPAAAPTSVSTQSFTSLLPKALSAVLYPTGRSSDPQQSRSPASLEQVQSELRELRDQFHQMKRQHNNEIKLLMSELDEEKRIRLTIQFCLVSDGNATYEEAHV
ncbi:SH3 domain-containing kinase-binding protein 1 isoform X1 [Notothenia coriiceps]|uniref:SH3 domain-containing kinase-binding protein 1 isoform X1 n=3 Tax=Notothenia coriiceps TaxID=8208 RepID=A0A6I9Q456_9TELE|nr:PREDICTED: SH3 domain-containing kinase-binding protein 1 isoform X1 [Notothenia coriiceps]XP_010793372.1 PREDICTED: SH3 domain-containing kinase-binding protein 1 isoform X1 [Notothenia coriiceps]